MPAAVNMYGESEQLTAPLASIEDLSRVNTPGGSPSPRTKTKHPALVDPNWEPPEDPSVYFKEKCHELSPLQPKPTEEKPKGPEDRFALVFLTLVLHGVGTLMPWNMFITAKNYFVNYKLGTATVDASEYTTNFLPYLGYASQVPNVLFNWINIFVQLGGNLTTRIVWSILIEVIIFIVTVVLAMVDSSGWPGIFFWTTMASVIVLNIANGIYQNTIYGLAARLPFKYTGAVILGSNISGTFTAIINIVANRSGTEPEDVCHLLFHNSLRFYRYHEAQYEKAQRSAKRTPGKIRTPYWHIFKTAFPQLFNVFMIFFVTLAVFPAVLADTCRTEEDFFITPKYFQAVTCFLTFNLFAMLGNMLPGLPYPGPKFLCIPVLLRIFFIPAFVLCHYYPYDVSRTLPVLIDSDLAYWILSIFLGLTSGYYSSLAMMYCPRTVEPEYAPVAGMMGAASLITGIFAGINFQVVCSYIVTRLSFEIPGFENTFRNCTDRVLTS
ncbi:Equilibrative nucleoside transporter 1 [Armadillidium nasatum]|uniref:Equilibrative nucleoside transporter 1 n=1 Tax=Armadillidium nasatum TaxID=96803 RepID=A0A5N5TNV6_9CRUS|nr:Equilibrative nucleoside transporter 1 [Armadillidium nasatum]